MGRIDSELGKHRHVSVYTPIRLTQATRGWAGPVANRLVRTPRGPQRREKVEFTARYVPLILYIFVHS